MNDFLGPLGAKRPKCDFDDPYMVLGTFCSPRGAQMAPLGCLCDSWAPPGAPSGPSRGSVFRSQSHFGRQTSQSVILSLGAPGVHLGTPSDRLWAIKAMTFQLLCCFLEFPGADQSKCDFEQPPSWFWLVFATHVVAKWHLFGLLGLIWDPSVADLGQPRTQLFNFLVPWGRLGVTNTSFLVLRGLAGANLEPLRC